LQDKVSDDTRRCRRKSLRKERREGRIIFRAGDCARSRDWLGVTGIQKVPPLSFAWTNRAVLANPDGFRLSCSLTLVPIGMSCAT
jgi:hypothetical protein